MENLKLIRYTAFIQVPTERLVSAFVISPIRSTCLDNLTPPPTSDQSNKYFVHIQKFTLHKSIAQPETNSVISLQQKADKQDTPFAT